MPDGGFFFFLGGINEMKEDYKSMFQLLHMIPLFE